MSELDRKKTIEQLLSELEEARKGVVAAQEQSTRDLEEAGELELKAANREKAAVQVYNGCAKRFEEAVARIRQLAPDGTDWGKS